MDAMRIRASSEGGTGEDDMASERTHTMTDRTNRQLMTRPEIERMMREYGQESAMALYERRRTSWWRPGR